MEFSQKENFEILSNAPSSNFFCYFKHEIQLFKVLLSLKVVKFDTKMYLNFSNFQGRTLAGGGQALVQKWGQVSDGGGIGKIFAGWGTPVLPKNNPSWTNNDLRLVRLAMVQDHKSGPKSQKAA